MRIMDTVTCPTCGRGYPAKFWCHTFPKPWRLGIKQVPGQRFKVLGDIKSPGDLQDPGVFGVVKSRVLEAVANWVFRDWLDVREVLGRVADLKRWAGKWIWHQFVEVPGTLHRVDHGFGWGKAAGVEVARVDHRFRG